MPTATAVNVSAILWRHLARGAYWKLTDHGDNIVSLQNTADTNFKDWYLDIDGHTGSVILWEHLGRGGYWKLTDHGDNIVSLQNTADTNFKDWYLDIDGRTGSVILWEHLGRGGYWKKTTHADGTVSLQNTADTNFTNWYLDIDGNASTIPVFPIEHEQHDRVGDGFHMTTRIIVSETGRLDGFVEMKCTNNGQGFTGQVIVFLLNEKNDILWNTQADHSYGINAAYLSSARKEKHNFTEQIPNDKLLKTRKVYIYQRHTPKSFKEILDEIAKTTEEVNGVYEIIKNTQIAKDIATAAASS
ncbi:hypothetical protein [Brevibacillus porteri]|uniref:Uncharacterized protein n=1 Tax=Brevibacillus porteri TaxID=2126350 RepID=A0ABX5FHK7_9BACL|nr:hypothetical protein [Brevibacillus porteri]MED1803123.1 hypothetical protein [Brevibacillus porteri]MED2135142.1 hypothetical protein [Brevibacillus porteri]MED2748723.1 hypothetical protein [Brevibacillus porteri]MED2816559.1 hypothetical protein [Brevibacillus porteri]MED2897125.1 hypothetical protein [Brevibacillus porteri]